MTKGSYRVRVISGELKGRLLYYPTSGSLRPTLQRAKSSIFDILRDSVRGAVFVDLFAAAGGIGIEALSRGANFVCFVEQNERALACLRRNLDTCRIEGHHYRICRADVVQFVSEGHLTRLKPDIVYADPPYGQTDFAVLMELLDKIAYSEHVSIIVEHPSSVSLTPSDRLLRIRQKSFGQTSVSFFSAVGQGDNQ